MSLARNVLRLVGAVTDLVVPPKALLADPGFVAAQLNEHEAANDGLESSHTSAPGATPVVADSPGGDCAIPPAPPSGHPTSTAAVDIPSTTGGGGSGRPHPGYAMDDSRLFFEAYVQALDFAQILELYDHDSTAEVIRAWAPVFKDRSDQFAAHEIN